MEECDAAARDSTEVPVKLSRLQVRNFRGIKKATLLFPDHVVLIGDNNTGKSTVLEAIDLVLGPDRLSRRSPIDEHDFHIGRYLPPDPTCAFHLIHPRAPELATSL